MNEDNAEKSLQLLVEMQRKGPGESLEKVALPSSLQSMTFGLIFDRSLEKMARPSGLQNLSFGRLFKPELGEGGSAKRPAEFDL